ncbi:hypothetical protein EV360DRAFT_4431, partial [Lentinula raphanica]
QPCARIQCKNEGQNAHKASTEDCSLEPELVLARGAKMMLTRNLWQTKGLVNGTLGTLVDIVWKEGSSRNDLPLAVLIEVPTYTGPTLWRSEPRDGFPQGAPIVPISIYKQQFEYNGNPCSRTQLPL